MIKGFITAFVGLIGIGNVCALFISALLYPFGYGLSIGATVSLMGSVLALAVAREAELFD